MITPDRWPLAEALISARTRLILVSSLTALITHDRGCAMKNAHAIDAMVRAVSSKTPASGLASPEDWSATHEELAINLEAPIHLSTLCHASRSSGEKHETELRRDVEDRGARYELADASCRVSHRMSWKSHTGSPRKRAARPARSSTRCSAA